MNALDRRAAVDWGGFPNGLMRLTDMLNCYLAPLHKLSSQLSLEIAQLTIDVDERGRGLHAVSESDKDRLTSWLTVATEVANNFEWKAVHDRIKLFSQKLQGILLYRDFLSEIRVLHETIDCAVEDEFVYRYPTEKTAHLERWKSDWSRALTAFPSSIHDIVDGIDCWALGHPTASVFHMMRVLEHGLRALAKDVNKNFDVQNWQNIIDEIESEIRHQGKTLPRGLPKNERLRFLSEAAKEFVYFKDGWRNYVSHTRTPYDEHQARSVIEHVREFMTILSSSLRE